MSNGTMFGGLDRLTYKRVARVCQHQLSFMLSNDVNGQTDRQTDRDDNIASLAEVKVDTMHYCVRHTVNLHERETTAVH